MVRESLSYTKNKITPPKLMIAPTISRPVTFCLKIRTAGKIINTGTILISVDADPATAF